MSLSFTCESACALADAAATAAAGDFGFVFDCFVGEIASLAARFAHASAAADALYAAVALGPAGAVTALVSAAGVTLGCNIGDTGDTGGRV